MYYVVRKDVRMTLGRAMSVAGAAAVRCVVALGDDPRVAAWRDRPRKVALRASGEELLELGRGLGGVVVDDVLLCLPPMRKSERPPLLSELRPFTDAPRPPEPPAEPDGPVLTYVIRPGVIKTMGKAMAQAGHAALAALDRYDLGDWRDAGCPGRVRAAGGEEWERLRSDLDVVVVTDAGHTQVAPGTETVIALPPGAAADSLEPVS